MQRGDGYSWHGNVAYAGPVLALALAAAGRRAEATGPILEGLRAVEESRFPLADADCLATCAAVVLHLGDAERAACLLGAARGVMATHGAWRRPTTGALYIEYVRRVRAALPAAVAERARDRGRQMDRDEALAYARDAVTALRDVTR